MKQRNRLRKKRWTKKDYEKVEKNKNKIKKKRKKK